MTLKSGDLYNFDFEEFKDMSGNKYSTPSINDYFTVTAAAADENTTVSFIRVQSQENAIISDGTYFYALDNGTDSGAAKYSITLAYRDSLNTIGDTGTKNGKIQDDYYVTFFTNASAAQSSLYHLEFSDWGGFELPTYPTLASDNFSTHLITGVIFTNENFLISDCNTREMMSLSSGSTNDRIWATFRADVGVNESIKTDIEPYLKLETVEVYQSFLIMLNKRQGSSSQQGIATRPSGISVSDFVIKDNSDATVATIDTDIETDGGMTDPYQLITSNHIELRSNENLRQIMLTACGTQNMKYTIYASFVLSYSEEEKMSAQFPTRDTSNLNNATIGTLIGGSSNIASTPEAAIYSKNAVAGWDTHSYYCTINTNAELTLNSNDADNPYGEFFQLGINEKDINPADLTEDGYVPVKLNAVYDVSDLSASDDAETMKLTFKVSRKSNYNQALIFSDYIDGLTLYSYEDGDEEDEYTAVTETTGGDIDDSVGTQYVYEITDPKNVFNYDNDQKTYKIPITFNAVIGEDFGISKEYSNYMIKLEIELYNADGSDIDGSRDDDHVIFTHAKVLSGVID